jgi:hypothetical protein
VPRDWAELIEEHAAEMVVDAIDTGQRWKDWAEAMERGEPPCRSAIDIGSSPARPAITSGSADTVPEP